MVARAFPPDVFSAIFVQVAPSPADLARVLLVSHAFYTLAKPILYHHVTIRNKQQRWQLADMSRANQQLVKHVTVYGDGPIDMDDLEGHTGFWRNEIECRMWYDCVKDILTGKLLDISQIETLHVHNEHETEDADSPWEPARYSFKVAANLREISVWGHQGGAVLWKAYLKKKFVPALRRLGYVDVTRWDREVAEWDSQGRHAYYSPNEVADELGKDVPFAQLELVIADTPSHVAKIKNFPVDGFLATVSVNAGAPDAATFARAQNIRLACSVEVNDVVLQSVRDTLETLSRSKTIKFVSIPGRLVPTSHSDLSGQVQQLRSNGIEVAVEKEEADVESPSRSIILSSFVDYLEQNGRLQPPPPSQPPPPQHPPQGRSKARTSAPVVKRVRRVL
ncbi:hypothetical protein JCM11491_003702 [Sporobolomyces phaffii]